MEVHEKVCNRDCFFDRVMRMQININKFWFLREFKQLESEHIHGLISIRDEQIYAGTENTRES